MSNACYYADYGCVAPYVDGESHQHTTEEDILAAIGWFFDGPYLINPEAMDNLVAIVILWKERNGR